MVKDKKLAPAPEPTQPVPVSLQDQVADALRALERLQEQLADAQSTLVPLREKVIAAKAEVVRVRAEAEAERPRNLGDVSLAPKPMR